MWMARTYKLDHFTKGTGASVVPVDDADDAAAADEREFKPRRRTRPAPRQGRTTPSPRKRGTTSSTPLPPGHVRKKATGEIGRVKAVDPKAGTVTVQWLRQGRTSVVPLATVSRR